MKLSLLVMNAGKASGQSITITTAPFVIGRDPGCQLRPASAMISKKHCAILVRQGQVFVRDFESTNGTFLNDVPVKGEVPVNPDDILKAGPLQFRVLIEKTVLKTNATATQPAAPAAAAPKPAPKPPTPVQPPRVERTLKGKGNDDDAADMLLSDDDTGQFGSLDESRVPEGSTVLDMPVVKMPESESKPAAPSGHPPVTEKKKFEIGSAQDAAKAILSRLNKRK